jgi:hypothetical protein
MIAYFTRAKDSNKEHELPDDCPWSSWYYNEGDEVPDNAIVVTEEEFDSIMELWQPIIQRAKDKARYRERAKVKDELIVGICADNMERIRNGVWTVAQLIELTADPSFKNIQDDINSLSFELAQGKIMASSNPLITQDVKNDWVGRLQADLFNNIEV